MGRDVIEVAPEAAALFAHANDILGYDLKELCIHGPEETLNSTAVSQPAIFVTSAALLSVMRARFQDDSLQPDVVAGLSMGEYTAIYAAGLLSFEESLRLVAERGRAMQAAADQSSGSMVSIIGLDEEKVEQLCTEAGQGGLLAPANYNCPGQIVISGDKDACERAVAMASDFGAIKAIPLAVAGAFHTELMQPAAMALGQALANASLTSPTTPRVMANVNAEYYTDIEGIVSGLVQQLVSPILWQRCMERLLADDVEQFYEIGPGRVLTGLMRRIHRKTRVINVSSMEALTALA
jgi:[acyl-carrier-protein] S-malonyltransferase